MHISDPRAVILGVIGSQVRVHVARRCCMVCRHGSHGVVGGEGGVKIGPCSNRCRGPVGARCGWEESGSRRRRDWSVCSRHEIQLLLVLIGHEEVLLILVRCRICSCRLHCLGNACKVKFVCVPFAVDLGHNVLIIVVSESSGHFVVVHVWF